MKIKLQSCSGSSRDNPTIQCIEELITQDLPWESIGLTKENESSDFLSELIIIKDSKYGIILHFCDQLGLNEYLFVNHSKSNHLCKTFDGGDSWSVPQKAFHPWKDVEIIINNYLKNQLELNKNWLVIGKEILEEY